MSWTLRNGLNRRTIAILLAFTMVLAILVPYGTPAADASPNGEPVVIHATWKVRPGDVVGIYGGYLNDSNAVVKAQPLSSGLPLDPVNATVNLEVIRTDEQLIQAQLPDTAAADVYAVWVETTEGTSNPFWFNRAEPFWISDIIAYEGQSVRVFGRNLLDPSGSSSGTAVTLIDTSDNSRITASIAAADAYTIDFTVPAAAVGGDYRIEVTNGVGGASGAVVLDNEQTLTVVAKNANATALESQLGLSVHWLNEIPHDQTYSVLSFGAVADGVTDDTEAIQDALDQAEADGGGIVTLPAGTYAFSSVSIPSRTLLLGEGKDLTQLIYNGESVPDHPRSILPREAFTVRNYGEALKLVFSDGAYSGIADLSITSEFIRPQTDDSRRIHGYVTPIAFIGIARGGHDNYGSNPVPANSPGYLVKNVHMDIADGSAAAIYSTGLSIVEDSEFLVTHSGLESNNNLIRFRDNEVSNMMRPGTYFPTGRVWYEGNSLTGIDYETYVPTVGFRWSEAGGAIEHRYSDFPRSESYVAGNSTNGVFGSATGNEGEGMLWQGQGRLRYSQVTSAAAQSLTDTAATYTSAYAGMQVTIVGGKGLGQQRNVTAFTANVLELDRPWDIVPDATSVYTVDKDAASHNIVINNDLQGQTNKGGIMFYNKDYDNIIEGNTLHNTGGIWLAANQINDGIRADYSYFTHVNNNILTGSSKPGHGQGNTLAIGPGADGGIVASPNPVLPSTGIYGNEYRNNDLTSIGDDVPYNGSFQENYVTRSGIVVSTPGAISHPMAKGVIVADNKVRDAYAGVHLANSSHQTLLANNDLDGNGEQYKDNGSVDTLLIDGNDLLPYKAFGRANHNLDGKVTIRWPAVQHAQSYTIARSISQEGPFTELSTISGLEYEDMDADALPYYYQLTATDSAAADGPAHIIQSQFQAVQKGDYDTAGRSFKLAVSNGIAYVADNTTLQVLDVSDPDNIVPVSALPLGGATTRLYLDGDLLYATGGGNLYIIDVSDPALPAVIGSQTIQNAGDIKVVGGLAYIARGTNGLGIYDITDPSNIIQIRVLSGLGNISAVDVDGDYAYAAAGVSGLHIVDVSTPATASVVETYTSVFSARDVKVKDGYAYVANSTNSGDGGLLILDVSTPSAPLFVSQYDTDSATIDVELVGPYAMLGGYRNQLVFARVLDPELPIQVGVIDTPSNSVFDTLVEGNLIYMANSNAGIKVFSVE